MDYITVLVIKGNTIIMGIIKVMDVIKVIMVIIDLKYMISKLSFLFKLFENLKKKNRYS